MAARARIERAVMLQADAHSSTNQLVSKDRRATPVPTAGFEPPDYNEPAYNNPHKSPTST